MEEKDIILEILKGYWPMCALLLRRDCRMLIKV